KWSGSYMAGLLEELESQIAGIKAATTKQNVGVIREVGDGVARVEGLSDAMLNEMLDLGHGVTGLALNLEETEVGVIVLGDYTLLQEGDEVRTTGKLLQVPVGMGLLGRVVNTLGEPVDGQGPLKTDVFRSDAMLNEMLDLGHGVTGLALNLEETEVGVIVLGDYTLLQEGDEVRTTGKLLQVPVGMGLLGRVVNTLGEPVDGQGPLKTDVF